jgi:predicted RNase H-like HicB family nuclease
MDMREYPINIHYITEEGNSGYYLAFLPDFGYSACSATGDTIEEVIDNLREVYKEVVKCYLDTNKLIPKPTKFSIE